MDGSGLPELAQMLHRITIFNPIEQGRRFDENGDYIRKYVPELAHLSAAEIH
jgi:deoxyribodipyrimidine photolyase